MANPLSTYKYYRNSTQMPWMINDLLAVAAAAEAVAHVDERQRGGGCILIIFQSSSCIIYRI